ncbi:MAG: cupin domain-containing protein [Alphaproteobacteria bacterium]|nr:cupin domain-containing protein [Alphaproteobacteria bacterium]
MNFNELEIMDYTSSIDSSSSLAVVAVPPNGFHPPAYSKRSDKFYFVIHGTLLFTVGDDQTILEEGDVSLVQRGEVFSYRNHTQDTARLILVHTPSFDFTSEIFTCPLE